jgi:hypothetical protein
MSDRELERRLRALPDPGAPADLEARLMRDIPSRFREREPWWRRGRVRIMTRIGMAAAAGAVALWLGMSLFGPGAVKPGWAQVLEPVAAATGQAKALHLTLRLRSRPGENFEFVNLGGKPQTVEAWVRWPLGNGDVGRVRVQKSDLLYAFDGKKTVFYRPEGREVWSAEGGQPHLELFWPAAWLQSLLKSPPEAAQVLEQKESGGKGRLVLAWKGEPVTGRAPAFFEEFDREAEIEWDLANKHLLAFNRWVLAQGERVLYSELASIEYLPDLGDEVFRLDIPADARPAGVQAADPALDALEPRAAAERFWQASLAGDWKMVEIFCPSPHGVDWLKDNQPQELIFLGEPFRTGGYAGVYIPYRVRLGGHSRGRVAEGNLALRNDNPFKRWVWDGGL